MKQKILVVDDSPTMRELLSDVLNGEGYEVAIAHDGDRALALVDEFKPDLIILDLLMPQMDGYTMLRALRKKKSSRSTPVIVLTVKKRQGLGELLQFEKISAFIEKPFDQGELVEKVREVMGTASTK